MCEAKPGTRCAADTCDVADHARRVYDESHPGGLPLDPLSSASASFCEDPAQTPQPADESERTRLALSPDSRIRVREDGDVRVWLYEKGTPLPPEPARSSYSEVVRVVREVDIFGTSYDVEVPNYAKFDRFRGEAAVLGLARDAGATGELVYHGAGYVWEHAYRPDVDRLTADFSDEVEVAFVGGDMVATVPGKGGSVHVEDSRMRREVGEAVPILDHDGRHVGASMTLNHDGITSLNFIAGERDVEEQYSDMRLALRAHASRVLA